MLQIRGLDTYYGESRVIAGLDLTVKKGSVTALIGRNGVGKSTTLKSVMGLCKTPSGHILLEGQDLIKMPTYNRVKSGIGYVPQGRDIFPRMTVQENLELGLRAKGGNPRGAKSGKIPEYIYELFPILPQFAKRKGGDLSGGQQQQLAIARALAADPKILILDEPTEGIQPSIIQDIGRAIRKINTEKSITVFLVEQYLEFVLNISDSLYIMEKGEIVKSGATEEMNAAEIQKILTE
ncbi:MAG: urea ABC transporter ATP-binding subunit UrtE [Oscillospiraceae bacterium]|jgi:urea transport system ATP-binding protein|nr:urea ABC transporter ATP-binding subunit UrtE [Oscillospiraceae bacterium]